MKKIILFALLISLICVSASVSADADSEKFVGKWYLNQIDMSGVLMEAAQFGLEIELTIHDDGTAYWLRNGNGEIDSWSSDGRSASITDKNGTVFDMVVTEKSKLVLSDDEGKMIYTKEPPAALGISEPDENAVFEDYIGVWTVDAYAGDGYYFTAEQAAGFGFELDLVFRIEESSVSIVMDGEEFNEIGMNMDGPALVLTENVEGVGEESYELMMHEDGRVVLSVDGIEAYFAKEESAPVPLGDVEGRTFVMTDAEGLSGALDSESLGTYAVTFMDGGKAEMTISGEVMETAWDYESTGIVVDYWGDPLHFVSQRDGTLLLDFMGAMILTYAPK